MSNRLRRFQRQHDKKVEKTRRAAWKKRSEENAVAAEAYRKSLPPAPKTSRLTAAAALAAVASLGWNIP